MSAESSEEYRTFGNWRRPVSAGLGRFTTGQTLGLFVVAAGLVIVEFTAGVGWALTLGVAAAVMALIASRRDKYGMSVLNRRREKSVFKKAKRRRTNLFRTGWLSVVKGSHKMSLPGVVGTLKVTEHTDAWRRAFALVHHADGTLTVVMALSPKGEALVDRGDFERKVGLWGNLFVDVANESGLVAMTVAEETSPDSGALLRREVASRVSQDAPSLARRVIDQVVDDAAGFGVRTRSWLTLTFDPKQMGVGMNKTKRAIQEICTALPGLTSLTAESADGAVQLQTRADLTRLVREAYDPEASEVFDLAAENGEEIDLAWQDAGPISANAQWDYYRHDSGASRSWVMASPPMGTVHSTVLRNLMAPKPDVPIKRVTFLYQPMDPAKSPEVVETDVDKAQNSLRMGKPTARKERIAAQAKKTAMEEAMGAAVVDFGVVITATVRNGPDIMERLEAASSAATSGASSSRLLVRPAYGAQHSAFALGLPLGIMPTGQKLDGRW